MVTDRIEFVDVDFPWRHPVAPSLPTQLKETLWHARHFSELMLGAALLYNLMLAESRAEFGWLVNDYRSRLEGWWEGSEELRRRISPSIVSELWTTVESSIGHRIPPRTRTFVTHWYGIALNVANAQTLMDKPSAARTLVSERERQLKNVRARIGNDKMLVNWNGSSGAAQLNYRWNVASQIIDDIVSAL
jgi:hypothetical protein